MVEGSAALLVTQSRAAVLGWATQEGDFPEEEEEDELLPS